MLLDWGRGKICYTIYITLQITNCWEHFMLSVFAISKPVLLVTTVFRICLTNTSKDTKTEALILQPCFLEKVLKIGPQGTKKSHKLSLRLRQIPLK